MRKFSINIGFTLLFLLVVHALTGVFFADGKTDPFYLRFTSDKQKSLILGTSRAAVGLRPKYIHEILKKSSFDLPIYNFSFTIRHSPFGPYYLNAIKKKLNPTTKHGLFIITVDPWAISREKSNLHDSPSLFREKKLSIGNMWFFNLPVNYEYLVKNYPKGWGNLIITYFNHSNVILKEDGWVEVNVPMDSTSVAQRIDAKIKSYKKDYFSAYVFSSQRYEYLCQTITLLQNYGKVYLIRLPVAKPIKELEDKFMPNFDSLMVKAAIKYELPYYNFINDFDNYQTTDGNHLYKTSAAKISKIIAAKIKN